MTSNLVDGLVAKSGRTSRKKLRRNGFTRLLRRLVIVCFETLRRPGRGLLVAWVVGIVCVGSSRMAWGDGIFAHPAYADSQSTLFEAHGPFAYALTVLPDDEANSWLGLTAMMYQVVGVVNAILLWVGLVPLYGALTLLEWFLSLTVYQDAATQIDAAVASLAGQVFWPLITATAAIGATVSFGKWQADGRSPFTDLAWVITATTIAVTFLNQPSTVMREIDSVRQHLGAAVITGGTTTTGQAAPSITGYPNPTLGGPGSQVATRNLVTGLWDSFGATPWCLVEFHDLDLCASMGSHALANDQQWQGWMTVLADNGQVNEFREWQNWVRGMDLGRLGYALILVLLALPAAVMMGVLVFAGLAAVIGVVAMLLLAVLALVTWPIPGWFRRFGTQWWGWLLGFELQALFLTAILTAVMVVSRIVGLFTGQYGFFLVALLNLALMFWAVKMKGWVESTTVLGGAGTSGMLGYLALWGASKAVNTVTRTARGALQYTGNRAAAIGRSATVQHWFKSSPGAPGRRPAAATVVPLTDGPPQLLPAPARPQLPPGTGDPGWGSGGGGGPQRPSGGGPGPGSGGGGPRRPRPPAPGGDPWTRTDGDGPGSGHGGGLPGRRGWWRFRRPGTDRPGTGGGSGPFDRATVVDAPSTLPERPRSGGAFRASTAPRRPARGGDVPLDNGTGDPPTEPRRR